MKIEMGESLFYSWLRHVKECQFVQTNWKVSSQWELWHEEELQDMMTVMDEYFYSKYKYRIFKQNSSLSQLLQQGECDVVGICIQNGINQYYAVDVAFHGAGLNYGTKEQTVMKVVEKSVRTALCLYGFLDAKEADIIFASPKINPAIMEELQPCITAVNKLFEQKGFSFAVRLIANEEFNNTVLQPILLLSDGIADTSELFMRSYQMYMMFEDKSGKDRSVTTKQSEHVKKEIKINESQHLDIYSELKIGKLVQQVLRKILENNGASEREIDLMQQEEYSKRTFHINYPLLVPADENYNSARYYSAPIVVNNKKYMLCNDWYERGNNNDRPYIIKWITDHT